MEKLTTAEIEELINKRAIECSEDELKELFSVLGLRLKEYRKHKSGSLHFEIHYKREYVLNYREFDGNYLGSFGNEYIDFDGEGTSGMSMRVTSNKELIQLFFGIASRLLRLQYEGVTFDEDESIYSQEEFTELIEKVNEMVFDKN
jgi:nuclear transport factor 2 (NTF2) superfamily protein